MSAKHDPLEAAKIESAAKPEPAKKPKAEPAKAEAPPAPAPRPPQPPVPIQPMAPLPLMPTGLEGKTNFEVLEGKMVSWHGSMTHLPAGTIVSVNSYGRDGIQRLAEQGVKLKPID